MSWFEGCIVRSYAFPVPEYRILQAADTSFRKTILRTLNDMGIDITDLRFDETSRQLFLKRTAGAFQYELPFEEESGGVRKLIAALPVFLLALLEGRPVIVDELDAKLHPEFLRYIVSLFTNRETNRYGAQLIFTSHDISTMNHSVFRRDEVWFAAENDAHESGICSLREICGRKKAGSRA